MAFTRNPVSLGTLVEAERERDLHEMIGRNTRLAEQRIEVAKKHAQAPQRIIDICRTMPRPLGRVLYSTGRGLSHGGSILDLALVAIDPAHQAFYTHSGSNNELPQPGDMPKGSEPDSFVGLAGSYGPPKKPLSFGKISKGGWYFKKGRTTDITVRYLPRHRGVCQACGSSIEIRRAVDQAGRINFTHIRQSWSSLRPRNETLVEHSRANPATIFVEEGDSGAVVIGQRGDMDGLLFGSICGLCGPRNLDAPPASEFEKMEEFIDVDEGSKHLRTWYGENCGLVTSFDVIGEHLRLTEGASLRLP